MLPASVEPVIKLTAELTEVPYSLVRDIVNFQFRLIKDYTQGKRPDIMFMDFHKLGRFYPFIISVNNAIIKAIPLARKHKFVKDNFPKLWGYRKAAKDYEQYRNFKTRFGS